MGTIFEELIRRFNEEQRGAGEHFTRARRSRAHGPCHLHAHRRRHPVGDIPRLRRGLRHGRHADGAKRDADQTGDRSRQRGVGSPYGQEVNPETFAISKADLILKGEGAEAENMKFGSTLSADAFPSREFDFMLSNPPYGKSWKTDLEAWGARRKSATRAS